MLSIIFISSAVTVINPVANVVQPLENAAACDVSIEYSDPNLYKDGVTIVDCDPDLSLCYMYDDEMTKENILAAEDRYFEMMFENSSITDIAFCIFQQLSFLII